MGKPKFTEEFKVDAVKQITVRGHSVADVSQRLGVSTHSLYAWMKRYSTPDDSGSKDDLSRNCAAPLIAYYTQKENDYGNETHSRI